MNTMIVAKKILICAVGVAGLHAEARSGAPAAKEGYWSVESSVNSGAVKEKGTLCVGAKMREQSLDLNRAWSPLDGSVACDKKSVSDNGSTRVDVACEGAGEGGSSMPKMRLSTVFAGDFDKDYTVSTKIDISAKGEKPVSLSVEIRAVWMEPACPQGMGDGDLDMEGQKRVNALAPAR